MYEQHLQRAINDFGPIEFEESWSPEERCIVLLRTNKLSYGQIQQRMGDPPKKRIREVLLKCKPELIDLDCNHKKLKAGIDKSIEKRCINLLRALEQYTFELEVDDVTFYVVEGTLYMRGDSIGVCKFTAWDTTTQQQIYNEINEYRNR